jgi:hypothetical protein
LPDSALEGKRLVGRRVFGSGLQPGDGFLDALGEGDLGLAEEGVGFFHRGHVVRHHAAVTGGGDVEGLAGQGGDEVAGEAGGAEDGAWDFAGWFSMEGAAESVRPVVNVTGGVTDVEGLPVDFFGGLFEESDHLVGHIADVAVAAHDGLAARMDVETFSRNAPEFLRVAGVPRTPNIGRPHHDPLAAQVGTAGFLFGDDLALSVDGGGEVVLVVDGETSGPADKLGRAHEHAPHGRSGLDSGEEIAGALGIGAKARLGGGFLVHLGARGEMHHLVRGKTGRGLPQQIRLEDISFLPEGPVGGLVRWTQRKVQDLVSFGQQSRDHMGSDESGTAGDEDFHGSCFFTVGCPCECRRGSVKLLWCTGKT